MGNLAGVCLFFFVFLILKKKIFFVRDDFKRTLLKVHLDFLHLALLVLEQLLAARELDFLCAELFLGL